MAKRSKRQRRERRQKALLKKVIGEYRGKGKKRRRSQRQELTHDLRRGKVGKTCCSMRGYSEPRKIWDAKPEPSLKPPRIALDRQRLRQAVFPFFFGDSDS